MKPVAYYGRIVWDLQKGVPALLYQVWNHGRVHGKNFVMTSPVVKILEDGAFETENTLYRPRPN